jgi:hypothetical protein
VFSFASSAQGEHRVQHQLSQLVQRAIFRTAHGMATPSETKGKVLKAFELTWVMYDPTDRFGVLMALFTLSPVYVRVCLLEGHSLTALAGS